MLIGSKDLKTALLLAAFLAVAGCGGEPYTYIPENDVKAGPGLFTGEDGQATILSIEDKEETTPDTDADQDKTP